MKPVSRYWPCFRKLLFAFPEEQNLQGQKQSAHRQQCLGASWVSSVGLLPHPLPGLLILPEDLQEWNWRAGPGPHGQLGRSQLGGCEESAEVPATRPHGAGSNQGPLTRGAVNPV